MPARIFIDRPLLAGSELSLPPGAARHVQVLRLQPGAGLTLFDGHGGEFAANVTHMGRREVRVRIGVQNPVDRELAQPVTLALGMPANERMDTLIEKATELGVAAIVPLTCERSVLRLQGERAEKKLAHWRGVAIAASEQSGRTRLPALTSVATLAAWLGALPPPSTDARWLLSLGSAPTLAKAVASQRGRHDRVLVLSGPEGGLSPGEEELAQRCGFAPVNLGPRVMRADTAPLAVLACLGVIGVP
jgi:16S rRNA (uracil1498-N3)-methyltransferase